MPVIVAALLLLPAAAAAEVHATTSTGKIDQYGGPPYGAGRCTMVVTHWVVTLSLLRPEPGEAVLLHLHHPWEYVAVVVYPPGLSFGHRAFATYEQPRATIEVTYGDGCTPFIAVAGLVVVGEKPYALSYERAR